MHWPKSDIGEKRILMLVDVCLASIVFLLPLMLGGRHPWGQLALAVLAVTMALAWAGRCWLAGDLDWRPTNAGPLLLVAAALVLLQCVPLPAALLGWLAPGNSELLPLWKTGGLGDWQFISITPAETQAALAVFLAYCLIFFVTAQRIRAIEDVERLLRWCGLAAACMAAFGLIQFFAGNGKFLWFYEDPFGVASDAVKGSFTNRNHFTHFLALGVGPLIWWLQDSVRRRNAGNPPSARRKIVLTPFLGLALVVVAFAAFLSLSRAGMIVMFLAAAICAVVCYRATAVRSKMLLAMVGCGLLVAAGLFVFGFDRVAGRLDSVSSGSIEKLDHGAGRRVIWGATIRSAANHVLLGSGSGSFAEVYPAYADAGVRDGVEFTHGESGPLQLALETGLAGLALLLAGVALCTAWCFRGLARSAPPRVQLCAGAIAAGLSVSAVHSLADFVWYVPACMAMATIFAACALRTAQLAGKPGETCQALRLPRLAPLGACAVLVFVGGWMIVTLLPPAIAAPAWTRYRLALNAMEADAESADVREVGHNTRVVEAEKKLIGDLEQVVAWQPTHARAHLALAESHLRLFALQQATAENPMSLVNIRDAVSQSRFPARAAMRDWLHRAVGQRDEHLEQALLHARRAIQLCPLLGRGYVYLAELCFLDEDPATIASSAYIDQALKVRPFDGTVLRGAASEAYLAGDQAKWLDYTKRAFHCGSRQQRLLIVELLGNTADANLPHMIDFVVRELQPDLDGLRFLHTACARRCSAEQLVPLQSYRAGRTAAEAANLDRDKAARAWLEASLLYRELKNDARATQCARDALDRDPSNYDIRYQLATCLLIQRQFADAERQWRWCRQRAPNNSTVEANLREAVRGRLEDERRAAADRNRLR